MEASQGRFTDYVELHFAYLVLDNPRNRPFQKAFHALIRDKEVARALVEYCRKRAMGGVCG
jgi:hypothetical protein